MPGWAWLDEIEEISSAQEAMAWMGDHFALLVLIGYIIAEVAWRARPILWGIVSLFAILREL